MKLSHAYTPTSRVCNQFEELPSLAVSLHHGTSAVVHPVSCRTCPLSGMVSRETVEINQVRLSQIGLD